MNRKKQNKTLGPKVFVGLSGGVDSSVSAALLKKAGFDVTGVFIKVWQPDFIECSSKEDRLDAMRICAHLDIPFITLDLQEEYKRDVIDYMISEYATGRTPNPDVMCNKYVKFGAFLDFAKAHGADYVATGHYATIKRVVDKHDKKKDDSQYFLQTSRDSEKDQTYFLWTLTQEQLKSVLFPVGNYKKNQVRKLAQQFGLATAAKKDSQGLCFLGKINIKDFLSHYIKSKPGAVLNEEGKVIGSHQGAIFLTIGERHGFTILKEGFSRNAPEANSENTKPHYVIAKDIKKNTVTVSEKKPVAKNKEIIISSVNFTAEPVEQKQKPQKKLKARIRYRETLSDCTVQKIFSDQYRIFFDKEPVAPSAGQSVVIYDGKICIGGGIIK